jgi:hypothetical protein
MQGKNEAGPRAPINKPHLLEYIASLSYELALLAKDTKLDFIAYLLNIIHLESSREMGQYPLENPLFLEERPKNESPLDMSLHILKFSQTMSHSCEKNELYFLAYLFKLLEEEVKMILEHSQETV